MATVIPFPSAKGPLEFDGMGMKIDIEALCESFQCGYANAQIALNFCNLDHVKAAEAAARLVKDGLIDEAGASLANTIEALEAIIEVMKKALIRLEISERLALASMNGRST